MSARAWALCMVVPLAAALVPLQTAQAASQPFALTKHAVTPSARASAPISTGAALTASPRPLDREVFGYAYLSSLGDSTVGFPSWNFDLLSTVAVFSIGVNFDGVLVADSGFSVWDSSTLTNLVTTAHQHGVKVVPTLTPAWRDPADFCDTLYNGQTTVNQIVNQIKLKGVDGVNIDYEGSNFQCNPTNPGFTPMTTQQLMIQFAGQMRAGLNSIGPGYYLSLATYSGSASANDGFFNIPALNQYVDSFFVMAYDMDEANQGTPPIACGSFCMAPISPIANYYWNDSTSMSQYSAAVGPGKVILGQPYYGRVACVTSAAPHAWALSYPDGDPRQLSAVTYLGAASVLSSPDVQPNTYIIHRDPDDPNGYDRWDTWYDNKLGCLREMYWEDTTTLGTRYNLVNQDNLRGVGLWTLSYGGGAPELWSTLQAYFVACSGAGVTPNPASPQLSATPVVLSGTSANCNNPLYEFWIQPPGGSWSIIQPYSSTAKFNWSTAGLLPGTYRFTVYVRSAATNGIYGTPPFAYDSVAGSEYQLTTQPCASVTSSTSPAISAISGSQVTITGSAPSCPNPQYEFWMLYPGANLYTLVQGYTSSPTLTWKTAGLAPGSYRINVWVRDASSVGTSANAYGSWDAYNANATYQLTAGCIGVNESNSPSGGAMIGMPVQVTGAATGCPDPNPQYEFWILAPGASLYTMARPYSTSPTLDWSTTGLAPGTYRINIWVRDANSAGMFSNASGSWDTYNASLYYVVTSGCPSVAESASASGTTITIAASAPGCPTPQYEFWILYPGATSYKLMQSYGSSATLTWPTAGLPKGTYRINVWVRDATSKGADGNASGTWDAYNAGLYYTVS
ncbi:MAG TPA: glycosyl hydrolase family 18 protein [Candidatus Dormibacteraeota bacterium]|nr:glycosyl hydrolase family 18 protein [Candidatus Dormibacteraeota bacterium]